METYCQICNKYYSSYQSLWIHNKKYHKVESKSIQTTQSVESKSEIINIEIQKKFICDFCKKEYQHKQSKYKHLKSCKEKIKEEEKINLLKNYDMKIQKLNDKINKLEKNSNKIYNYNNINNCLINNINSNNKQLNINNLGEENVSLLTLDETKKIMSQGMNSIVSLVDHLNFNERLPQNHNFYVSAINDKHVNTLDPKTNCVIKKSKKDLFDQILISHMTKLESISKNSKEFSNIFDKLKLFIYMKQGKKEFINQINLLSYNKRNLIVKTWENLINDMSISPSEVSNKFEAKVKQITEMPDDNDNYESDSESSIDV